MSWWSLAFTAGLSLFSGWNKSKSYDNAATQSYNAAQYNSAEMMKYAGINADLMMGAAHRNAEAIERIGRANAEATLRAYERNKKLYTLQADEEVRRHVYGEKKVAGEIRAAVGASGLMTNTGTPQQYLRSTVYEGIYQRNFMKTKHQQTLLTMKMEAQDKASLYLLTASEQAAATMANAEAGAAIALNDAMRQSSAMMWQGQQQYNTYQSQSSGAWWDTAGTIGKAVIGAWDEGLFDGWFS